MWGGRRWGGGAVVNGGGGGGCTPVGAEDNTVATEEVAPLSGPAPRIRRRRGPSGDRLPGPWRRHTGTGHDYGGGWGETVAAVPVTAFTGAQTAPHVLYEFFYSFPGVFFFDTAV